MAYPRFSIVIPTYKDASETLGFTLQTCLGQSFEDFEVIVCHDTSSPTIKKLVEDFSYIQVLLLYQKIM